MSLTEFNEAEFIENRRAEGVIMGIEQVATRMIRKGVSDEDIENITGGSVERIRRLRKEQTA